MRAPVWEAAGAKVREAVWAKVRASVGEAVYGQHDAGWLSYYAYFREVCGLTEQTAPLEGLFGLARTAGWALPHANICWIAERHNVLRRDERGRLHCPDGPALTYPDGWSIWAWHGVRVPERIILGAYTAREALGETNAERKRVMVEKMGTERFFRESGATVVHSDTDGRCNRRRLLEIPLAEARHGRIRAVEVVCPTTGRQYLLGVPATVQTCREAVAATFGMSPEQYAPEIET